MTVAAKPPRIIYDENGVSTVFAAPFRYKSPADLRVVRLLADGTAMPLTLGLDYQATVGDTDSGGTVTIAAPGAGSDLKISRVTPRNQDTVYTTGDRFPAKTTEGDFDVAMLVAQELDDIVADTANRALLVPEGEASSSLPALADRAGTFLAFDADGNPTAASGTGADAALRGDLSRFNGIELLGTRYGSLPNLLAALQPRQPTDSYVIAQAGVKRAIAGIQFHFYDPQAQALREVNGGDPFKGGTPIPYTDTTSIGALWMRHAQTNVWHAEWKHTGDATFRTLLVNDYARAALTLYPQPGMFTGGYGAYKGGSVMGAIVSTFDDGVWLTRYHRQADEAGYRGADGTRSALAYAIDTFCYALRQFQSPASAANPVTTLLATAPNLTNIDYGLGSYIDLTTGMSRFTAPPVKIGKLGSLYTVPANSNYVGGYGMCSSALDAHMGCEAMLLHERTGYDFLLAYAVNAFAFVRDNLLTPDPTAAPNDPTHTPLPPTDRKAQYLVETEFCLDTSVASNDPYPVALRPRFQWYGKPRRDQDSTYLGGAMAFVVLGARLYRYTGDDGYRVTALRTIEAIRSSQAYGRTIGGKLVLANTRDPHSEGHYTSEFVAEGLTLPGVSMDAQAAMVASGEYVAQNCVRADGYSTADWSGPEFDGTYYTWEADYANNGNFAGAVEQPTSCETVAFLQGCRTQAEIWTGGLPLPITTGYDASAANVVQNGVLISLETLAAQAAAATPIGGDISGLNVTINGVTRTLAEVLS